MKEVQRLDEQTVAFEAILFLLSLIFNWDIRWQIALGFIWGIDAVSLAIKVSRWK